jgi:2-methylcitrate dehydratase PrpD
MKDWVGDGLTGYKPLACGVVLHPIIDACMQIRDEGRLTTAIAIHRVVVKANPLVLTVCVKTAPRSGIEGKISVYHAEAIAMLRGDGSQTAYIDAAVAEPAILALRDVVEVVSDPTLGRGTADVTVALANGELHHRHVEHAIGRNER